MPLIEGDDPFAEQTAAAVREYAVPLKEAGRRHRHPRLHPLSADPADPAARLRPGRHPRLLSAEETALGVAETLQRKRIENDPAREGSYTFLTTGDTAAFRAMGRRFLQLPIGEVEHVEIAALEAAAAA